MGIDAYQEALKKMAWMDNKVDDFGREWREAHDLLQSLIDKQTPEKGIMIAYDGFDGSVASCLCCKNCKQPIVNVWSKAGYEPNYCHYCGKALAWSEK